MKTETKKFPRVPVASWENAESGDTIGKEKSKHTPVPWVFAYGSIYQGDNLDSLSEGSLRIAMMDRNESRTIPTERDENARFICRAVNSHADLLAALREWQKAWAYLPTVHRKWFIVACNKTHSAIQKATGAA